MNYIPPSRHWIYKFIFLLLFLLCGSQYMYISIYQSRHFDPLFDFNSSSLVVHVPFTNTQFNITSKKSNLSMPLCPEIPPDLKGRNNLAYDKKSSMKDLEEEFSNRNESSLLDLYGHYKPIDCEARYKVAILVPYRDRFEHLSIFISYIHRFLQKQQLDYTIFIIEQAGESPFNRAMLFNAGYVEAMKIRPFDCFIFHDVDLLPEDDRNLYNCPEQPRHMSVAIDVFNYRLPYQDLFGGVCAISAEQFESINGFSNMFWGWGGEDDDISARIKLHGLQITRYPSNIAKYVMLKHKKQTANPERYEKLYKGRRRFNTDGLNSLEYKRLAIRPSKLFTWIYVNLTVPS